jgi:hypothetical protein
MKIKCDYSSNYSTVSSPFLLIMYYSSQHKITNVITMHATTKMMSFEYFLRLVMFLTVPFSILL